MVIHVTDHLSGCATNEDGEVLLGLVEDAIRREGSAVVDFHGVLYTTTSFVNSAFLPLLERMSFDEVKKRLRIVKAYPQITSMIRDRMSQESSPAAA